MSPLDDPVVPDQAEPLNVSDVASQVLVTQDPMVKQAEDEAYLLVEIGDALSSSQAELVKNLLCTYRSVFSQLNLQPMKVDKPCVITLKPDGVVPFQAHPRYCNQRRLVWLQEHLQQLVALGFIKPCSSVEWVAPITIVAKPDGGLRLCISYTELNRMIQRDYTVIPRVDHMLRKFSGKKFFAKFDMPSAFWQTPVEEKSQLLLAFITPLGMYVPCRLPFSLAISPGIFRQKWP